MFRFAFASPRRSLAVAGATLLLAGSSLAFQSHNHEHHEGRNFDARIDLNQSFAAVTATPLQMRTLDALRADMPDLAATFDETTGVTRTLYNQTGYLTDGLSASNSHLNTALNYVTENIGAFGISLADLENYEITDDVFSQVTGAQHLYLRQMHQGLPVYNGQLHVNINRDGRIISVNNAFVPGLASAVNQAAPTLKANEAVAAAALHLGVELKALPQILDKGLEVGSQTTVDGAGLSLEKIDAQLMWLPVRAGDVRLVWNFQVQTLDYNHYYDMTVDAHNGEVLTRFDWTNSGSYRVYEQPEESPIHASPLPPSDARTLAVNPEDGTASPNGWFSQRRHHGWQQRACLPGHRVQQQL